MLHFIPQVTYLRSFCLRNWPNIFYSLHSYRCTGRASGCTHFHWLPSHGLFLIHDSYFRFSGISKQRKHCLWITAPNTLLLKKSSIVLTSVEDFFNSILKFTVNMQNCKCIYIYAYIYIYIYKLSMRRPYNVASFASSREV